jgi:hypothetical protein
MRRYINDGWGYRRSLMNKYSTYNSFYVTKNKYMISDAVCQWLVKGRWFFPGTPVSSTIRHDITEILLKVVLNTINLLEQIPLGMFHNGYSNMVIWFSVSIAASNISTNVRWLRASNYTTHQLDLVTMRYLKITNRLNFKKKQAYFHGNLLLPVNFCLSGSEKTLKLTKISTDYL